MKPQQKDFDLAATPQSENLRFEVIHSIGAIEHEWSQLALASRNVFATPEWARAWLDSFRRGSRLHLITAREGGGGLVAIVPIVIDRFGPLRVARFIGHSEADILGPIHDASHPELGPAILERALREEFTDWDVFLGERLPGGVDWLPADSEVFGREANPVLDLSRWPTWEAYVASLSQKLRYEVRRNERALAARHRISFRMTTEPGQLTADLDVLFSLHYERWKDGQSSFTPRAAFHRRFAGVALERGWLRLWILEIDGRPAAARYDFQFAGVHNAYNAGRDPAWSREGVGLVIRAHSMREAMARGVTEYRFLRGAESYKKRFLTEDAGLVTVGAGRTWLGRRVASMGLMLKENEHLRRVLRRVARHPAGDGTGG